MTNNFQPIREEKQIRIVREFEAHNGEHWHPKVEKYRLGDFYVIHGEEAWVVVTRDSILVQEAEECGECGGKGGWTVRESYDSPPEGIKCEACGSGLDSGLVNVKWSVK